MAITNFIPTVWSEQLYRALDKKYVAVKNCNRDFEGEIKGKGSSVKICGVGEVTIADYTKDTDLSAPQTLSDSAAILTIDRAKCFNFQIDDIDRVQATPKLMEEAMRKAADGLADEADKYVCSLYYKNTPDIKDTAVTAEAILDHFIAARTALAEQNVTDPSDIVFEVHPKIAALLLKAKLTLGTDNGEALDHGSIGTVLGSPVYVSNNIKIDSQKNYYCCARTKRAIAFAEQLSEIDAYRPEKRFADAVKGLHLYGAKIIYPNELFTMALGIAKPTTTTEA